jgi:hypothetical protein
MEVRKYIRKTLREAHAPVSKPDLTKFIKYLEKQEFRLTQAVATWHPDGTLSNFIDYITETTKIEAISVDPVMMGNWRIIVYFPAFHNKYTGNGSLGLLNNNVKYSLEIRPSDNKDMEEFFNPLPEYFGVHPWVPVSITIWNRYERKHKEEVLYKR